MNSHVVSPKFIKTPKFGTPGKSPNKPSMDETQPCYIAFIENGAREVGAALMFLSPPSLHIYQYSDTALYSHSNYLLEVHNPSKILIPSNITKSPLSQLMISQFPSNCIIEIQRARFSELAGENKLLELGNNSFDEKIMMRYLGLSATAACLYYVQTEVGIEIMPHSLKIEFRPLDGQLLIDPQTLRNFSILSAPKDSVLKLSTSKKKSCLPTLFNLLDHCYTPSGSRILRAKIAGPPSDESVIIQHQNFVSEIIDKESLYNEFRSIYNDIVDIDPVITLLVINGTKKSMEPLFELECLNRLYKNAEKIKMLQNTLLKMDSELGKQFGKTIRETNYIQLAKMLSEFLDFNINDNLDSYKRCNSNIIFSIKPKTISILDITRKSFEDSLSEIYQYAKEQSEKYNMNITIKFNKSRRFYLSINKKQLVKIDKSAETSLSNPLSQMAEFSGYFIPPDLIHVFEVGNCITGTTYKLLLLNKKNESSELSCIKITQKYIETKMSDIMKYLSDIYKVSEVIGFVDSLLSLAIVAHENENYHKPKIVNNQCYILRNARHPIYEQLLNTSIGLNISSILSENNSSKFVPNDLEFTKNKKMMILKGVNMSGKSTYLQMVIQIAIMAQIGSYIPCDNSTISPFDSIFTRCGTIDSIEGNSSAFFLEMKEINNIISHATDKTLIALDEPCASTSVRDGIGISFAYLEYLLSIGSFVLCATHFDELKLISNLYSNVVLKEMRTRKRISKKSKIEFLYHVGDGSTERCGYGIDLASSFLPKKLIEYSKNYFKSNFMEEQNKEIKESKSKIKFIQKILSLRNSSDNELLISELLKLKTDYEK